jgi:hypothetical protein
MLRLVHRNPSSCVAYTEWTATAVRSHRLSRLPRVIKAVEALHSAGHDIRAPRLHHRRELGATPIAGETLAEFRYLLLYVGDAHEGGCSITVHGGPEGSITIGVVPVGPGIRGAVSDRRGRTGTTRRKRRMSRAGSGGLEA